MQPETTQLRQFLSRLNDEADAAHDVVPRLLAAPHNTWPALMQHHPEWLRYGVFDGLLLQSHDLLDSEPQQSLTITSFVLSCIDAVRVDDDAGVLAPLLRGTAWKEHANAYYALAQRDSALTAIEQALAIFRDDDVFAVDYAAARLTYAQIIQATNTRAALDAVDEAVRIFANNAQERGYLKSLQVYAEILTEQHDYEAAQKLYRLAYEIAERREDEESLARITHNRGTCALRMGEMDDAVHFFTRAFSLLERRGMHAEVQRAVWGLASVAHRRGDLDSALEALQDVYAQFLHRGMTVVAAAVLVEVGHVVTELTGNADYAHEVTRQLAETLGTYDAPANVRAAVTYLEESTMITSVPVVQAAFAHVRSFFQDVLAAPSLAFVPE